MILHGNIHKYSNKIITCQFHHLLKRNTVILKIKLTYLSNVGY